MRISKLASFLTLFAVVATLVFSGCVKKPRLDLSGVQGNPAAGEAGDELDNFGPGGGEFIPGSEFDNGGIVDPFADGNGGQGIGDGAGEDADGVEKGGAWGFTEAPVAAGADGAFLKNEQRYNDCVIYFAYDQYEVAPGERAKLDELAQYLVENPNVGVIVEGHTDERGSDEYNRALGERRALAVVQYLGLMGVAANRCKTISYGEDRPAVAAATTDADHQLNRRAEFLLGDL